MLDRIANILVIASALIFIGVVVEKHYPAQHRLPRPIPGEQIHIQNAGFSRYRRTVVLALRTDCHFCTESAGFYQDLIRETSQMPVALHVIAALPQPSATANEYLAKLKMNVSDVRQLPLGDLHVSGTPTILLVDDHGTIVHAWVGRLSPNQELEVMKAIREI